MGLIAICSDFEILSGDPQIPLGGKDERLEELETIEFTESFRRDRETGIAGLNPDRKGIVSVECLKMTGQLQGKKLIIHF